jgi:hypothetical protein
MASDHAPSIEILGWFPLRDGRWPRLSRENRGGRDSFQLRVCVPDFSAAPGHRHWRSPAGPMRLSDAGFSLERAVWRRIARALRTADTRPVIDTTDLPMVTSLAPRLASEGRSRRHRDHRRRQVKYADLLGARRPRRGNDHSGARARTGVMEY